jgi:hypothetical protein
MTQIRADGRDAAHHNLNVALAAFR